MMNMILKNIMIFMSKN